MASAQNRSANVVLFDAYFRRADLDRDGRIRGNEAVASFQGSGLPKQVLAQTWAHADQRQTGFLGQAEFILLHEEKQRADKKNQSANVDLFDAYFRRANLDHDGRISGNEAVTFFQGSGLPKQVLAQTWAYTDQRQTGFLGRAVFYNAFRLVTVSQSKREVTPGEGSIVWPGRSKIPAPKINLAATSVPQFNSAAAAPAIQGSAVTLTSSQNFGFRGLQVPPRCNSAGAAHATLVLSACHSDVLPKSWVQGITSECECEPVKFNFSRWQVN